MKGRAVTDRQKRMILDRLYAVWTASDAHRCQRLGQLIDNSLTLRPWAKESARASLFNVEDSALIQAIEDAFGGLQ